MGVLKDRPEDRVPPFEADLKKGQELLDSVPVRYVIVDRTGNPLLVPRLALSIGVVTGDLCEGLSYLEIKEAAAAVTGKAKSEEKSAAYMNHRRLANRALQSAAYEKEKLGNI